MRKTARTTARTTAVWIIGLILGAAFSGAAAAAGEERVALSHDGVERSYLIYAPPAKNGAARPIVIVLHGGGGNAENAVRMTGFTEKARAEGFIAVYPNGTGRFRNALFTWNAGHCCSSAMRGDIDDVGFIAAVIDDVASRFGGDPNRVYATGMSNGAMMAHRLGRDLSDKIAAIAPVVGGLFGDEKEPPRAVAAIIINGALDKSIPEAGGETGGRFQDAWDGSALAPAEHQGDFWAGANGCAPSPRKETPTANVILWRYDCPEGGEVLRYMVEDNGHAWPGGEKGGRRGDQPSASLDATDVIWDFFKTKSR
ncbi:MAG: PHB depolymerase family esterase [Parvularculaceae bacterium]